MRGKVVIVEALITRHSNLIVFCCCFWWSWNRLESVCSWKGKLIGLMAQSMLVAVGFCNTQNPLHRRKLWQRGSCAGVAPQAQSFYISLRWMRGLHCSLEVQPGPGQSWMTHHQTTARPAPMPDDSLKLPKGLRPPTSGNSWATSFKDNCIHLPKYFHQIYRNVHVAFQEGNTHQDLNHPQYHPHSLFSPFPQKKLASRPTRPDPRALGISSG